VEQLWSAELAVRVQLAVVQSSQLPVGSGLPLLVIARLNIDDFFL